MTCEIVNSLKKCTLLLYCASRLTSNSAQASVLQTPSTPISRIPAAAAASESAHALHPKQPVQTTDHFYDWVSLVDRLVAALLRFLPLHFFTRSCSASVLPDRAQPPCLPSRTSLFPT